MNIAVTNTDVLDPISREIWDMKYRYKQLDGTPVDQTVDQTWRRVAKALARPELVKREEWEQRFFDVMADYRFLPAGRILAGAGTERNVTLFNCYVMGRIEDSMPGIFNGLKESALTMQQGGGIGNDFSTLRPKGAPVIGVGSDASGPLSFMDCWDSMCRTIMSAGTRRGAMMGVMRCDHPDIEAFIEAKRDPNRFRNFNLSVLVTDAFMDAVKRNAPWELVFGGKVYKIIFNARDLWDRIMQATYDVADPGVIFIDRINDDNNLNYCETIYATNPCGEEPLPPYGACLLGSINLTRFIGSPFDYPIMDYIELDEVVRTAVRMLDNVIEVSNYPLHEQEAEAKAKRRIGLGVTGLADALAMMRLRYGSDEAAEVARIWMEWITHSAYEASIELAAEKGVFPAYSPTAYGDTGMAKRLPMALKDELQRNGIRNSHLTSIAPTGTISLFAGNVSGGVEPIFAFEYERKVLLPDGTKQTHKVEDYAVRLWRAHKPNEPLPDYFVTAQDLTPDDHLKMQAALQPFVDSSISKTINCPASISFDDFKSVYMKAYDMGLKGCTTYRPNDVTGSVLSVAAEPEIKTAKFDLAPRAEALPGRTYKLKLGDSHAIYVTINDVEENGVRRPYEIFVNSKNMEHYAWTVALTRMVSAVFRRGGDVSFVVEELKAVFDPRGGHWHEGKYVPSVVAGIGGIVEKHMRDLGLLDKNREVITGEVGREFKGDPVELMRLLPQCPQCGQPAVMKMEGCEQCLECNYNKCG